MTRNSSSQSKRTALFKVVCLAFFAPQAMGFATTSSTASTIPAVPLHSSMKRARSTTLFARKAAIQQVTPQMERITIEEEKELLRQAVEMRRISNIESELMMRSTGFMKPLTLDLSKASGYGEDIDDYENAIIDGQRARELLVTRNMGLVHYCIKNIIGQRKHLNSLSIEDLAQEGSIGLARAVDRWNPAIGGRFSTYAVYWIRAAILRCIAERDDMVRVPVHVTQAVRNIEKGARRIGIDLTTDQWQEAKSAKQLAEEAGLTPKKFEEAMHVRHRRLGGGYIAFESWMQMGNSLSSDVASLENKDEEMSNIELSQLKSTLSKYLRPKEMEALSLRYGLVEESRYESPQEKANRYLAEAEEELFGQTPVSKDKPGMVTKGKWGEAMSFNEVGKQMQVSAEYGRRLCHAALKKLQQAVEEGRLEPALLL